MLLKFRFSNFRSFRTEQELSLIASKLPGSGDGLFSPPGLNEQVLPVAAIYGANASGKTAVTKALEFMANAVKFSHTQWQPDQRIPVEPFVGDDPALPSEFSVDFLLAGIRHQYGFAANSQVILREWRYVYPRGKKQAWFERVETGRCLSAARCRAITKPFRHSRARTASSSRRLRRITTRHS
ncbi:MAG: AAA family ATPase [Bryobacteraceae bacterium]